MPSESRTIRFEAVAYLVILLAAAWLRLANLGWPPLSEAEARHALAAAAVSGSPSPFDPSPDEPAPGASYTVATAALFQLFGSSEASARVLSALGGLALCFLPLLARRRIGAEVSLGLTALLSFSPVLVTASREAGPTSLAALGVVGVLTMFVGSNPAESGSRRTAWAAAFAALALTSGSGWVQGTIGLAIAFGLFTLWRSRKPESIALFPAFRLSPSEIVLGLVLTVGIATGLGLHPTGAGDTFEALGSWLSGWLSPPTMPVLSEIFVLPGYEPLLVAFGLIGLVSVLRRRDVVGIGAAFWALGALALALIYPGRSALDIVWVAVPVAYLASVGIVSSLHVVLAEAAWGRFVGMTGAYVAMAAFIYLQLAAYANDLNLDLPVLDPTVRLVIISVGILILAVLILLFGTGWSWSASGGALAAALFGLLSAISLASIVRLNFDHTAAEGGQLWEPRVASVGLREMKSTLDFLSRAYLDDPGGLTVRVDGSAPPSLAWMVRGFEVAGVNTPDETPPVVLAPSDAHPVLHADYLGQRLAISETNNWEGTFPPDVVTWWILHRSPIRLDDWVMLVRADVATQGGLTALGSETTP
jgi:hypothetical protein